MRAYSHRGFGNTGIIMGAIVCAYMCVVVTVNARRLRVCRCVCGCGRLCVFVCVNMLYVNRCVAKLFWPHADCAGRKRTAAARGAPDQASRGGWRASDAIVWWRHGQSPAPVPHRSHLPGFCGTGGRAVAENYQRMSGIKYNKFLFSFTFQRISMSVIKLCVKIIDVAEVVLLLMVFVLIVLMYLSGEREREREREREDYKNHKSSLIERERDIYIYT